MAAPGAERRRRALVIAPREAELVGRQLRVMQLGLDDIGHGDGPSQRNDVERGQARLDFLGDEPRGDRRAVVMHDRDQLERIDGAFIDQ